MSDLKDIKMQEDSVPSSATSQDEELGKEDDEAFVPQKTKPFIVLVACCAALGGLIFGYDIAGAGATFVMSGFRQHFEWTCADGDLDCTAASQQKIDLDKGLINGLFGVGAFVGAFINPYVAEKFGRRPALFFSNLVFILGASIQAAAPNMQTMWSGRIFSGMGIGMLSMVVPVYITECAPEHVRGVLGTLWQIAVTSGILIASAANLGLEKWDEGWRISYGGNILFSVILLFCLIFMPESPRWLSAHSTEEKLDDALRRLRYDDEVEGEKAKLNAEVLEEKKLGVAPWSEVFSSKNKMSTRVVLGMSFQMFQQLCGVSIQGPTCAIF
jgi:sugar porter (SP) family MFS transporter